MPSERTSRRSGASFKSPDCASSSASRCDQLSGFHKSAIVVLIMHERYGAENLRQRRLLVQLHHQLFPFRRKCGQLAAQVFGELSEAACFFGGDVQAELLSCVRDRCFDPRNFLFEKSAAVFHLFLLDGVQAAGFGSAVCVEGTIRWGRLKSRSFAALRMTSRKRGEGRKRCSDGRSQFLLLPQIVFVVLLIALDGAV